jgi:hypothetical protein
MGVYLALTVELAFGNLLAPSGNALCWLFADQRPETILLTVPRE